MKQFYLEEINTKDRLIHQGIFFKPQKPGKKAFLWVHGLTGRFYGDVKMMNEFAVACEKEGFGFASFNNRGHDMITSTHKTDGTYADIGTGREVFAECVFDIEAGVKFLVKHRFSEIYIAGMSTGANKVCYYAATQKNQSVAGVILLSPISDRLNPAIKITWYRVFFLKLLVAFGRGDRLMHGYGYFPGTPNRFLSVITPRSPEDVFDYGDREPVLLRFSSIQKPMMILLGGADQYADRPVSQIKKAFDDHQKSSTYKSMIITGADHGFTGKEKEVVAAIIKWVSAI